ncbi:MAG: hypothetical protein A3I44_03615 [Candidatus Sungbacteria bacterium RIFCSPLOWO2_02_FULL_51_17]|uniref:SIS domain-containing protein n=1 Tax=Candidatus Sungbacteria bacterium RIFCSPHIGHO2_02_FULL_51_29 TaxID=1802273 RepID=A0A1G2KRQ5_9BACT|nr:MAG: hypothetical protein A2676_03395 [Candidatus Sungbacteria bacterium RIFCSPHIGHO2_01_FULL_51_22]OHA02127.1 MAG: hypothetical protein A3C16_04895 [Candidatus Sungbacteria bacterium RIFCSPHIGHO2_02_FULL_51_29]OHA07133.1 MAG: hypothetical protein A3B29_02670 [Candidatus Sungbacteria bacterium RIFCSPLOWO2_01_FULL_51_34]OHA10507.1 MAG: hypothetical protein A3I44_03615 [Candidatus Sungbacteria bacterium RIFCSPLOWO2_02_FULL_51_17]
MSVEYVKNYLGDVSALAAKIQKEQSEALNAAIEALFVAWRDGSAVFILGNGGSASTASHFAADLAKTVNDAPMAQGLRALTPWDNVPLISAIVNDRPKEDYFTAWLDTYYEQGGLGIGISVHGGSGTDHGGKWSQNLLKGLGYIKHRGGITIGLTGFDGGPMARMVNISIIVPADSTPLVESFHVVLHHLIAFGLKERIGAERKKGG